MARDCSNVDGTELIQRERAPRLPWCRSFLLGQLISVAITATGIFSTELSTAGVQVPVTQSSLNYVLLCGFLISAVPVIRREGYAAPVWGYALWAFCDVEGNYLVVKAYQYTSITSVSLLDCFAIPVVALLSFCLLRARYVVWHVVAIVVCLVGVCVTLMADIQLDRTLGASLRGSAWFGDVLVILGATLYGVSNVLQERLLKGGTKRHEALGMLGLFGTLISAVQVGLVEREALARVTWSSSTLLELLGFQMCLFTMYVLTSVFLSMADAAVFNVSVLTSDVYSVAFAVLVQQRTPSWMYAVGFATTLGGLVLYFTQPPPTEGERRAATPGPGEAAAPLPL